jgi:hypothetical protein
MERGHDTNWHTTKPWPQEPLVGHEAHDRNSHSLRRTWRPPRLLPAYHRASGHASADRAAVKVPPRVHEGTARAVLCAPGVDASIPSSRLLPWAIGRRGPCAPHGLWGGGGGERLPDRTSPLHELRRRGLLQRGLPRLRMPGRGRRRGRRCERSGRRRGVRAVDAALLYRLRRSGLLRLGRLPGDRVSRRRRRSGHRRPRRGHGRRQSRRMPGQPAERLLHPGRSELRIPLPGLHVHTGPVELPRARVRGWLQRVSGDVADRGELLHQRRMLHQRFHPLLVRWRRRRER